MGRASGHVKSGLKRDGKCKLGIEDCKLQIVVLTGSDRGGRWRTRIIERNNGLGRVLTVADGGV